MSIEVRAQNTVSLTSVKAIKDATDQSAQLLAQMEQYAEDAGTTLTGIYQDAEDAKAGAQQAQESATTALLNLAMVQEVLEVVEWVAVHGVYSKTTDVAINPNKSYYTVEATTVTNPTNDDIGTYYESVNGAYVKTSDTSVVSGKTYYYVVGTPVSDPNVADIGTYYELDIDEAMSNYIMSHLVLTNDGLYVISDASAYRLLLASDGMYIKAPNGNIVNQSTANGNIIRAPDGTVIAHLGYGSGNAEDDTTAVAPYYTLGTRQPNDDVGNYSVAEGRLSSAIGYASHAEGTSCEARGACAHAEGYGTTAEGAHSHAEGAGTHAKGSASHASGTDTVATTPTSMVVGRLNKYDEPSDIDHERLITNTVDRYLFVVGNGTGANDITRDYEQITSILVDFSGKTAPFTAKSSATSWQGMASDMPIIAECRDLSEDDFGVYVSKTAPYYFCAYLRDTPTVQTLIANQSVTWIEVYGMPSRGRSNAFTVDWNGKIQCCDYSGNFKSIFDIFYPVGSYYETSDTTFDPNETWGGKWSLEAEGRVHIGAGTNYTVGATGGEATHTLTIDEMPSHTHKDGTSGSVAYGGTTGNSTAQVAFDATAGRATTATGGSQAHNNMPPYIVVNRWHRTA